MSGSIRLFVSADLCSGAEIAATAGQAHYLGGVMRRATGDRLLLFNGRDGEYAAEIGAIRRDRAVFRVGGRTRDQVPESDLWLLFALLKRDATDLVVQKATELGVSRLIPVITERTIADRINADRLVAIATEAAEQSERLTVPDLDPPARIGAVLDRWPAGRTLTVAAERRTASFPAARFGEPGALLVGPEGGFSRGEVEALERQPFVTWASLGPRILRAETAAIAGLALLQRPTAG